jgi:hypothetical protein
LPGAAAPARGVADGSREGADLVPMRPRPFGPECQDLFRAVADNVRALMEDGVGTGRDGQRIPWLADAKPVQLALAQCPDHERRRHHDESHILIGVKTASPQP